MPKVPDNRRAHQHHGADDDNPLTHATAPETALSLRYVLFMRQSPNAAQQLWFRRPVDVGESHVRVACCRLRGHRDWVVHKAGGGRYSEGDRRVSSISRQFDYQGTRGECHARRSHQRSLQTLRDAVSVGSFQGGQAAAVTEYPERQARSVLNAILDVGFLISPIPRSPVRPGFPEPLSAAPLVNPSGVFNLVRGTMAQA